MHDDVVQAALCFDGILLTAHARRPAGRRARRSRLPSLVGTEGMIVADDAWRYPGRRAGHRARVWKEFKGVGSVRMGVMSTDIFLSSRA